MKLVKVRMMVSIASSTWAYQPGMVVEIDADLAEKWLRGGHATTVHQATPVTEVNDLLADLSAEEALTRGCTHCHQPSRYVLRNLPFCARCFRAELES